MEAVEKLLERAHRVTRVARPGDVRDGARQRLTAFASIARTRTRVAAALNRISIECIAIQLLKLGIMQADRRRVLRAGRLDPAESVVPDDRAVGPREARQSVVDRGRDRDRLLASVADRTRRGRENRADGCGDVRKNRGRRIRRFPPVARSATPGSRLAPEKPRLRSPSNK